MEKNNKVGQKICSIASKDAANHYKGLCHDVLVKIVANSKGMHDY